MTTSEQALTEPRRTRRRALQVRPTGHWGIEIDERKIVAVTLRDEILPHFTGGCP
jgi:hypothetical protein